MLKSSRIATVVLLTMAMMVGCGSSGNSGDDSDGMPPFTRDFGENAYEFVTADTAIEEVTRILVYSDGVDARVVILRAGEIERSGSARLHADVIDDATLLVTEGRVNLDADGTFSNNDLVTADGFVLASDRDLRGMDIEIGMLFTVDYDFRAVLARRVPVTDVADLLFD